MAVASSPGYVEYSGNLIPEVWSGVLVRNFYDSTVFADIANTAYEGEIKAKGDKVIIRTTPEITVRPYTKGQDLQYETPKSDNQELLIDHANYFACAIDDIDKLQSDIDAMDMWGRDGGHRLKIAVDTAILGSIYADAAAANAGATAGRVSSSYNLGVTGTPVVFTAANAIEVLTQISAVAYEQNWPEDGRWIVIPAWMKQVISQSDIKNASMMGDDKSILRNGKIGMLDSFTYYLSNQLASASDGGNTCYHVVFGHTSGLTFASQMTQVETVKSERTFGSFLRGLNVFGYEVIKAAAIGHLYVRKG